MHRWTSSGRPEAATWVVLVWSLAYREVQSPFSGAWESLLGVVAGLMVGVYGEWRW